ncbi:MAG TPA: GAP family protein [Gaiellaceae bacterium]|jgi:cytochrome c biogenesis protein CcdA
MQGFLTVLPMAVVMSAGPQIVTATFLATSRNATRNSLAFLAGVAVATTIGVTVFFLLGGGIAGKQEDGKDWLDWVIIGLLVLLVIRVFLKRKESEPPKWMGRLERADPGFAARIGFLLYLLMPTDLISMATVGAYLARQGEPWSHSLGFVILTVLIAGLPFTVLLVMGRRAESVLPRIRDWMNANSWIVNEAVLLFFLAMALF